MQIGRGNAADRRMWPCFVRSGEFGGEAQAEIEADSADEIGRTGDSGGDLAWVDVIERAEVRQRQAGNGVDVLLDVVRVEHAGFAKVGEACGLSAEGGSGLDEVTMLSVVA